MPHTPKILGALKRHPILTAVNVACLLGGVFLTIAWSPEEWSLARQVVAGLFAGGGFGFTITATRMVEEVSEEVLKGHEHEVRSL